MFLPDAASFVSSLFFAVHPIHTEAVCNKKKTFELLLQMIVIGIYGCNYIPRSQV